MIDTWKSDLRTYVTEHATQMTREPSGSCSG